MFPLQTSLETGLVALSSYLSSESRYSINVNNNIYEVSFDNDGAVELVKFIESPQDEPDGLSSDDYFRTEVPRIIKSTLSNRALVKRSYLDRTRKDTESPPKLTFQGLCISGGGAKGLAVPGVIMALGEKRLMEVEEVVGASVGAVLASALAVGATPTELVEIGDLQDLPRVAINHAFLETMFNRIVVKQLGPNVESIDEFLKSKGYPLCNSSFRPIEGAVNKSDLSFLTFRQLFLLREATNNECPWLSSNSTMKELTIIGTNKEHKYEEKFSYDTSPDVPIIRAVLASGSAPFIMSDIEIDGKRYIDGGITNNTPHAYLKGSSGLVIRLSAPNVHTENLGFKEKVVNTCIDLLVDCKSSEHEIFDTESASSSERLKVFHLTPSVSTLQINQAVANYYPNLNSAEQQFYQFEARLESKLKTTDDSSTQSPEDSRESPEFYRYRKYCGPESYKDDFVNISIKDKKQIIEEELTIKEVLS